MDEQYWEGVNVTKKYVRQCLEDYRISKTLFHGGEDLEIVEKVIDNLIKNIFIGEEK